MNFQPNWKRWRVALAAVTLLTLPLLAYVQYRWIGDLSDREFEHMHENLRATTLRFAWDLNRRLALLPETFSLPAAATPGDIEKLLARQAMEPRTTEPWALIDSAAFIRFENNHLPVVWTYDTGTHALVRAAPHAWLDSVNGFDPPRQTQDRFPVGGFSQSNVFTDPAVMTILLPPERSASPPTPSPGILILKLNRHYLRDVLVRSLIQSHFRSRGDVDCDVTIASRGGSPETFYTDRSVTDDERPDVIASLAMPPLISSTRSEQDSARQGERHRWESSAHRRDNRRHQMWRPRGHSGPNPIVATIDGASSSNGPSRVPPGFGNWDLRVFARKGSVQGMVDSFRARNLAVSFGILLILGAGVTITLVVALRAERLARERMLFVAGVSHEFRTPLAVIRSAGENLADGVVGRPERAREYGRLIRSESDRLWALVEQALAYGGIRSGENRHRTSPVAIGRVIAEALEANRAAIEEHQITIGTEIAGDLPLIDGDPVALATAVGNLVANAIKYRGSSTAIGIRARLVPGRRTPEVAISVVDHGIGIRRKDQRNIFEPFFRGAPAVDAQIGGSGLGLSIVQHVAARHGGRIEVESRPGEGSTFTLMIPISTQPIPESSWRATFS